MADQAAVTFLLEQVKGLLVEYTDLVSGAAADLTALQGELEDLKAILKDISKKSVDDDFSRRKKQEIRQVIYEAEDTIDTCLTEAAALKEMSAVKRRMKKIGTHQVSLAKAVKSFREGKVAQMLKEANDIRDKLQQAPQVPPVDESKLPVDPTIRQDKVVGFEDEEKTLTDHLKRVEKGLDVVSIIGMPGLGKTTLAWKIFHTQDISYDFPIRIWVHVSQRINSRGVFLKIIKTFTTQDMSKLGERELAEVVREYLKNEKFLLVLDDVWHPNDWIAVKDALPFQNWKGKVLITSRELEVGTKAKQFTPPHNLRFLTKDESWTLLQLEVFGDIEICPKELKHLGRDIAIECDGVPLTIVVIGGILKDQYIKKNGVANLVKNEWDDISKNVTKGADKELVISNLVKASYDRMPDHLKEPFLYLGVFPEDYELSTWTLTCLWIAEGLIQPKDGSLEEAAQENLEDLISRNLLIAERTNPMGEVKMCRVHDLIRTFCITKASEEKLFQEIKVSNKGLSNIVASDMDSIHRLCLHSELNKFFGENLKGPHVRSFLCFQKDSINLDPKYISAIPDSFPSLRVLHSKPIRFNKFPQRVTKLNHLRYLILFVDELTLVPEPISQLWNLQTIVVETKSRSLAMKANIWKMIQLRHFKTKAVLVFDKEFEGNAGKNLQTLTRVSPEYGMAAVAEKAHNLKSLGIRGKVATLLEDKSLAKLKNLEKLKLVNDLEYEAASENPVPRFPNTSHFPLKLKRLTLSNTYIDWENMDLLAEIRELTVLKLKDNAFHGSSWEATSCFKKLQFLLILNAYLVEWTASANAFPCLRHLVLNNCEKLEKIPSCVGKNLTNLEIERVSKSVADSAREIEAAKEHEKPKFKLSVGPGCDKA